MVTVTPESERLMETLSAENNESLAKRQNMSPADN